jgi:hypothetical protein
MLDEFSDGRTEILEVRDIRRIAGLTDGRDSCQHPDRTARMIRSALRT